MTSPSSRRPRRTSRPDRAGVPRGRRSTRTGTPTTGPGRRTRTTTVATGPTESTGRIGFAGSKLTRQLAVLGLVLAVVALSLAYPLKNFLAQRAELAAAAAQQQQLDQRITELQIQQAALADPGYITAEAKRRLQYVKPGDTVYVVQAPGAAAVDDTAPTEAAPSGPWYSTLWDTLSHAPAPAVDPTVLTPTTAPARATTPAPSASAVETPAAPGTTG